MRNLIYKELRLATPLLTFLFLGFSLMTFIPGYPVLCGAFFICLGMFQGYQYSREAGDMDYSVLLPVKKTDIVRAKFAGAVIIELTAFALMAVFTLIRMIFMAEAGVYVQNALMSANLVFLGFVLLIFALFNCIFIGGFFKTAYGIGRSFVFFIVVCFVVIIIAEAMHHMPGMAWINTLDFGHAGGQTAVLAAGVFAYACITAASCSIAQKRFGELDL